ncbi:hypothetical protein ACSEPQ_07110 [Pseudomonas aeruginosa]
MTYFVVDKEFHVILDVSSVRHSSPTNYYVDATAEQVSRFKELSKNLPTDHYLELADILNTNKLETKTQAPAASSEFRKSVANIFKQKPNKGNTK